jgi:hypothetical protein
MEMRLVGNRVFDLVASTVVLRVPLVSGRELVRGLHALALHRATLEEAREVNAADNGTADNDEADDAALGTDAACERSSAAADLGREVGGTRADALREGTGGRTNGVDEVGGVHDRKRCITRASTRVGDAIAARGMRGSLERVEGKRLVCLSWGVDTATRSSGGPTSALVSKASRAVIARRARTR